MRNVRFLLVTTIAAFTMEACSSSMYHSYKVSTDRNDFDGIVNTQMSGNYLSESANSNTSAWLNIQKTISTKTSVVNYALIVEYWATDWIFIGEGESLAFLIDGKRVGYSGEGSSKHRSTTTGMQGAVIQEVAYYQVTADFLHQIASAKEVRLRVNGSKGFFERQFREENFESVRRFVREYVDSKP